MFTSRGTWFFVFVFALLIGVVLGPYLSQILSTESRVVLPNLTSVAWLALTLGTWGVGEAVLFSLRCGRLRRQVHVERQLYDDHGPVDALWTGWTFQARLVVRVSDGLSFPFVKITDRLPTGVERAHGDTVYQGPLQPGQVVELRYSLRCGAPGKVRFEGIRVQLADLQGFFYHDTFIPAVSAVRVLPPLADARGHVPTIKRHNLLLPPGIHRHKRPGSGSELLELRDYLPGDPPKTIAWKVSARRDRLITKEFESDVPVRCTVFVDRSNSVRVGPPGHNALSRLVEIAAAVGQGATSSRDLTGLCLFDEQATTYVRPARGRRHLIRLLHLLADAACLKPTSGRAELDTLVPLGYAFAQEVYPEMLRPTVNRLASWAPWIWPDSVFSTRHPRWKDFLYWTLPFLLLVYGVVGIVLLGAVLLGVGAALSDAIGEPQFFLLWALTGLVAALVFVRLPIRWFFTRRRRLFHWRKRLAALLALRYGLGPGGLGLLLEDQEQLSLYLQRFLAEHQVSYPLSYYDDHGRYLLGAPRKVKVLTTALLRAVGKGHDNELFVLLADLLELTAHLAPLLNAVKVALARHHRVLLVCPWPPDIPPPGARGAGFRKQKTAQDENRSSESSLERSIRTATAARFHEAYEQVRRSFSRLGVPVVCAQGGEPARLILDRIDLLRGLGRRR
jgi:uncharacterized protein (DUF58 family)